MSDHEPAPPMASDGDSPMPFEYDHMPPHDSHPESEPQQPETQQPTQPTLTAPSQLSRTCGHPSCRNLALRGRGGLCGTHWDEAQCIVVLPSDPALTRGAGAEGAVDVNVNGVISSPPPKTTASMRAPRKRCLIVGCEKVAKGRCEGRCQVHYKEHLLASAGGDAAAARERDAAAATSSDTKRAPFFCSVPGCPRQAAGSCSGMCTRHYREQNPDGQAHVKLRAMAKTCRYVYVAGEHDRNEDPGAARMEAGRTCTRVAQGGCAGLCKRHWTITVNREGGAASTLGPGKHLGTGKKMARCAVADCGKYSRRRGMCQKHWRDHCPDEYKAVVEAEAASGYKGGIAGRKCTREDCGKWARGKNGLCRKHAREAGFEVPSYPSPSRRKEQEAALAEQEAAAVAAQAAVAAEQAVKLPPALDHQDKAEAATEAIEQVVAITDEVMAAAAAAAAAPGGEDETDQAVAVAAASTAEAQHQAQELGSCSVAQCPEPVGIGGYRGMCVTHWLEAERARAASEPRRKRCAVDGCDRQAREANMCHRHGRELLDHHQHHQEEEQQQEEQQQQQQEDVYMGNESIAEGNHKRRRMEGEDDTMIQGV